MIRASRLHKMGAASVIRASRLHRMDAASFNSHDRSQGLSVKKPIQLHPISPSIKI
jgi:hypothetical protein